jgi:predicted proteasome-type protease
MSLKIKLVLAAGAIALAAIAAWYVCELRTEVDTLTEALTRSQAVIEQMETNLADMKAASQIAAAKQESAAKTVAVMNREIKSIKEEGKNEQDIDSAVNTLLAGQLNRLFR